MYSHSEKGRFILISFDFKKTGTPIPGYLLKYLIESLEAMINLFLASMHHACVVPYY